MPKKFPVYPPRPHKSGQARITINQRDYYLGKHGSPESHAEYARLAEQFADGELLKTIPHLPRVSNRLTVSDLIAKWLAAEPRGKDHSEVQRIVRACVPMERLFGATLAEEFTAPRLHVLQEALVLCTWMTPAERENCGDWSRGYINKSIDRVRRVFRWAESRGLVAPGRWEHLKTVTPIKRNDRRVRNMPPVEPADWDTQIEPCLAHVSAQVAAMMQLQYLAGMRPGEVIQIRPADIDRDGAPGVWFYRPSHHKGDWRDRGPLVKALGPQAQTVLAPWLLLCGDDNAPIFRPVRKVHAPYSQDGYRVAVKRACVTAKVKPFSPYAIRHASKQTVTRAYGLDYARAYLGQLSLGATNEYAQAQDLKIIAEVARKIG